MPLFITSLQFETHIYTYIINIYLHYLLVSWRGTIKHHVRPAWWLLCLFAVMIKIVSTHFNLVKCVDMCWHQAVSTPDVCVCVATESNLRLIAAPGREFDQDVSATRSPIAMASFIWQHSTISTEQLSPFGLLRSWFPIATWNPTSICYKNLDPSSQFMFGGDCSSFQCIMHAELWISMNTRVE